MPSLLPILDRLESPERVSLPARSIQDQGSLDACFSCAIATALEARSAAVPPLSPAFHFHHATGGFPAVGMTDTDAFNTMRDFGMAARALHVFRDGIRGSCPLTLAGIQERPLPGADENGANRRFWFQLQPSGFGCVQGFVSENRIKEFLHDGVAVVAIIYPNAAYWNMGVQAGQPAPRPFRLADTVASSDAAVHAVCMIGFIEPEFCFVVQDSRGTSFGSYGQWLLPYEAVTSGFVESIFGIYSPPV